MASSLNKNKVFSIKDNQTTIELYYYKVSLRLVLIRSFSPLQGGPRVLLIIDSDLGERIRGAVRVLLQDVKHAHDELLLDVLEARHRHLVHVALHLYGKMVRLYAPKMREDGVVGVVHVAVLLQKRSHL